MSDQIIRDSSGRVHAIVSCANVYRYKGFEFEFHYFCGPCKIKKNGEPAARQGRKFFKVLDEWLKLSKLQQQATKITG